MTTALTILHVIVAFLLIGLVLLQRGVGAEIGASFGGGASQTLFGPRGATSFLAKLTWGLAIVFMATSLTLAFFAHREAGSVAERLAPTAPAGQNAAPSPQKPANGAGELPSSGLPAPDLPAAE